jgi:hypothetical protein
MSGVLYYRYHVEHKISNLFSVELTIPHKRSSRKSMAGLYFHLRIEWVFRAQPHSGEPSGVKSRNNVHHKLEYTAAGVFDDLDLSDKSTISKLGFPNR